MISTTFLVVLFANVSFVQGIKFIFNGQEYDRVVGYENGSFDYLERDRISIDYEARKILIFCRAETYRGIDPTQVITELRKLNAEFETEDALFRNKWLVFSGLHSVKSENHPCHEMVSCSYNSWGIFDEVKEVREFRTAALEFHNKRRKESGFHPIALDLELNRSAQNRAKELAIQNLPLPELDLELFVLSRYAEVNTRAEYSVEEPPRGAGAVNLIKAGYDAGVKSYNYDLDSLSDTEIIETLKPLAPFMAINWKGATNVGFGLAFGTKKDSDDKIHKTVYIVSRYETPLAVRLKQMVQSNVAKQITQ